MEQSGTDHESNRALNEVLSIVNQLATITHTGQFIFPWRA